MRVASRVLGFVGGAIALAISMIIILLSIMTFTFLPTMEDVAIKEFGEDNLMITKNKFDNEPFNILGGILVGLGGALFISGGLAIAGAILVNKKNILSGIFMLVGAVLALITFYGFLAFILLLLAGIFALVPDNSKKSANIPPSLEV